MTQINISNLPKYLEESQLVKEFDVNNEGVNIPIPLEINIHSNDVIENDTDLFNMLKTCEYFINDLPKTVFQYITNKFNFNQFSKQFDLDNEQMILNDENYNFSKYLEIKKKLFNNIKNDFIKIINQLNLSEMTINQINILIKLDWLNIESFIKTIHISIKKEYLNLLKFLLISKPNYKPKIIDLLIALVNGNYSCLQLLLNNFSYDYTHITIHTNLNISFNSEDNYSNSYIFHNNINLNNINCYIKKYDSCLELIQNELYFVDFLLYLYFHIKNLGNENLNKINNIVFKKYIQKKICNYIFETIQIFNSNEDYNILTYFQQEFDIDLLELKNLEIIGNLIGNAININDLNYLILIKNKYNINFTEYFDYALNSNNKIIIKFFIENNYFDRQHIYWIDEDNIHTKYLSKKGIKFNIFF